MDLHETGRFLFGHRVHSPTCELPNLNLYFTPFAPAAGGRRVQGGRGL